MAKTLEDLSGPEVAFAMSSRAVQENLFRYVRSGLDPDDLGS